MIWRILYRDFVRASTADMSSSMCTRERLCQLQLSMPERNIPLAKYEKSDRMSKLNVLITRTAVDNV